MSGVIVLDTNLLLLLTVGLANPDYVARHKRIQSYDVDDFNLLRKVVRDSSDVVLVPHVLAETSNLARYCREPMCSEITAKLASLILEGNEQILPSRVAVCRSEYASLGLTDAVLLETAMRGGTLLTADLDLYVAALTANIEAQNFNHMKEMRSDFH